MSSPVVHDRTIYLHSKNQRLTAMDVDTGEILWTGKPMGKYQSMVHGEGNALVLDEEGELLRVKLDRQELMIQERLKVADDSWAYLGIIQDGVVVRDLTSLKVYQTK
jgi:outer membrane protein assembly factor BamB